jgi:hypothetical protein
MSRIVQWLTLSCAAVGAAVLAPTAEAATVVAGGCRVTANVRLTPGLTLSPKPFAYAYTGKLTGCAYTRPKAPDGGSISAGAQIKIGGRLYQEPMPSGTGTCLSTDTAGFDFARWADGTQTVVQFTSAGGGGATHLTGEVVLGTTLQAADGSGATTTFKTTRFGGQQVIGLLTFHVPDASVCASADGLSAATITGLLGHVGPLGP